jgi:hypothetical protein
MNWDWCFYIYFDPFDYDPIYVGAGQGHTRPYHHLKWARAGRKHPSPEFMARLREGLAVGREPAIVVFEGYHAGQALSLETTYIVALGRRCDGTARLYNKMRGWGLPRPARGEARAQPRCTRFSMRNRFTKRSQNDLRNA